MKALHELTRDEIEDEIAAHSSQIAVATGRMLELLGELERRQTFGEGFVSLAHWLCWRTGLRLPAAREHVRVAKKLRELPETQSALKQGHISYSKARAITRVARPETEAALLDMAKDGSTSQLERVVRGVRVAGIEEKQRSRRIEDRRHFGHYTDEDGMVVIRGRLAPEEGALLLRAIEAAEREAFGKRARMEDRVTALIRVAERSLGKESARGKLRAQVVVHVDEAVLVDPSKEGRSELADGTCVSAETSRRLACDGSVVKMRHGPDGKVIDAGRMKRVISPMLARAVAYRDGGSCTFPGCSNRILDRHHATHWANRGPTVLENIASLCRRHHVLVHEGGYQVKMEGPRIQFFRPDGREFEPAPTPPPAPPPVTPDGYDPWGLAPTWKGEPGLDYDGAISGLM